MAPGLEGTPVIGLPASLQGTLTPAGVLSPADALQQQIMLDLARSTTEAVNASQRAGQAYQSAAAAPPPDLPPLAAFLPLLAGNLASVIGGTPRYSEQAAADVKQQRQTLLQNRLQNLQALRENQIVAAQNAKLAGNAEAEFKSRMAIDRFDKEAARLQAETAAENQRQRDAFRELNANQRAAEDRQNRLDVARIRAAGTGQSGGGFLSMVMGSADPIVIAKEIEAGRMPPDLGQYSRYVVPGIATQLAKDKFDVTKYLTDYKAFQRHWAGLNTGVQLRLQQSIQNAYGTAGVLDGLNEDLSKIAPRFRFTPLNRLAQSIQREGFASDQVAANITQLRALANTLRFELANVYMGGGVPTDQAQKRAGEIIDPDVSPARLAAQIAIARRELAIRQTAINTAGTVSPSNPATVEAQPGTTVGPRVFPTPGTTAAPIEMVWDEKQKKFVRAK